ncbi:MAG: BACON domain-containing carbohydrate-binding protein, partial [Mucinivorans sp.]
MKNFTKFLVCAAIVAYALVSCTKMGIDPEPEPPKEPVIEVTVPDVGTGSATASFTTSQKWTIETSDSKARPTWFDANPKSGGPGKATLTIKINEANTSYDDRSAYIRIRSGSQTALITVSQKKKDAILVSKDRFYIAPTGDNFTVTVKSNVSYQVIIPEPSAQWISRPASKGLVSKNEVFAVAAGSMDGNREGMVVFTDGTLKDTVRVYQSQLNGIILSTKTKNIDERGQAFDVELRTNVEYNITFADGTWLHPIQSKATRVDRQHFVADENTSYSNRTMKVIFTDKNSKLADTLIVNQAQKDALILSQKTVDVNSQGGAVDVELRSNIEYDILMPTGATWLTKVDSRALTTYHHLFQVAAYTGTNSRSAQVIFKDKKSQLADTLTVLQGKLVAERAILMELYNATDGPNWKNNTNWGSNKPLNQWFGIRTNPSNQVTSIILRRNNLSGQIPESIYQLRELEIFSIYGSSSGKPIQLNLTPQIALWKKIQALSLSLVDFSVIPREIYDLTSLISLSLSSQSQDKKTPLPLPEKFENLQNLTTLNLFSVDFKNKFPAGILKLKQLKQLTVDNVEAPDGIYSMTSLENVNLDKLHLSPRVGNLKKLYNFQVSKPYGELPRELFTLTDLEQIDLGDGGGRYNVTGVIPEEIRNLNKLAVLNLYKLNLTGNVPAGVALIFDREGVKVPTYASTRRILINNNYLTGVLPTEITNHPKWNDLVFGIIRQDGVGFDLTNVKYSVPDFNLTDIKGNVINSANIFPRNKFTILYNFATWCPFCAMFTPELVKLYDGYKSKGLEVIGFTSPSSQNVPQYIKNNKIQWNVISNSYWYMNNLLSYGVPSVVIVNSKGEVVYDLNQPAANVATFLKKQLGEPDKPKELYSSTDYSADGTILTLQEATKGKGVDIVMLGDGFVDRDMAAGGKYEKAMKDAMRHFFDIEPVKSYREYFNVYAVKVVSKNEVFGDPRASTALDVKFGEGTHIEGNNDKCTQYAETIPGVYIEKTLVNIIINSPKYAGTCWTYSDGAAFAYVPITGNDDSQFADVFHHEAIGHGFCKLLDEYTYYETYIDQTNITQFNKYRKTMNMGWNLTLDKNDIPWKHFIGHAKYPMVEIFEGGYFFARGVWRAEKNHCMNDNVPYFNGPSRELFVKRLKKLAGETYSWNEFLTKDKYV